MVSKYVRNILKCSWSNRVKGNASLSDRLGIQESNFSESISNFYIASCRVPELASFLWFWKTEICFKSGKRVISWLSKTFQMLAAKFENPKNLILEPSQAGSSSCWTLCKKLRKINPAQTPISLPNSIQYNWVHLFHDQGNSRGK